MHDSSSLEGILDLVHHALLLALAFGTGRGTALASRLSLGDGVGLGGALSTGQGGLTTRSGSVGLESTVRVVVRPLSRS